LRCVDALAQLQFDVLRGERDPLNVVFDEFAIIVRPRAERTRYVSDDPNLPLPRASLRKIKNRKI
jgi:hypothetical protein